MITPEQMGFARTLSNSADAFGIFKQLPGTIGPIDGSDACAIAKFSATLIIEFAQHGFIIADKAATWIQLFGKLPEFSLLTQDVHTV